jgi:cell division protein DivIC
MIYVYPLLACIFISHPSYFIPHTSYLILHAKAQKMKLLKNKYLLTLAGFAVWMIFFDSQDLITTHYKLRHELKQLEQSRNYYLGQIDITKKELEQLKSDPATLEKYAREKYHMKKDNEDLFIVTE